MKRIYEALGILLKYDPDAQISAEHDIIYCGGPGLDEVDDEDFKRLEELGWFFSDGYDSWAKFT